jgi:RimJ/RimL family protein N-acetyltransferase
VSVRLETARLLLRPWTDEDREPFAALNADPEVMKHFPGMLDREQSDDLAAYFQAGIDERGWGAWAAERTDSGDFIGFVGLVPVTFLAEFTPAVEVGWRLARAHWGEGFATEAGGACVRFGLEELALDRIVSFTACTNVRSEAVMRRLGMARMGEFTHPRVPPGSRLRRHVLYEIGTRRSP